MKNITIESYRPGIVGETVRQHAVYYAAHWAFDVRFEVQVATELAEFVARPDCESDHFRWASADGEYAGTVAVDGGGGRDNAARIRWFIVPESFQGRGVGAGLLESALSFCRRRKFGTVHLWTFKGLHAARTLYERNGFILVEERPFTGWGPAITEQKFERIF